MPRPPLSPLMTHLLLPPPLSLSPLLLTPRVERVCRLWGAGDWPLGRLRPGGELNISAIMARACSSGVPLHPNGGGAHSPCPRPVRCYPLSPSNPLRLAVGGLCRYWGPPPISCTRPHTKGVRFCSRGTPLYLSWTGSLVKLTCRLC